MERQAWTASASTPQADNPILGRMNNVCSVKYRSHQRTSCTLRGLKAFPGSYLRSMEAFKLQFSSFSGVNRRAKIACSFALFKRRAVPLTKPKAIA
jgi:hypothetical protein